MNYCITAYRLADAALDVWMICNRGTSHSLDHSKMSWRSSSYWNYSYSDIATKDVPKIIDYILKETGRPKLYYVAHSMGCNAFFAFITLNPEYNSKIITFIGMAPAVYVGNSSLPIAPIKPILLSHQVIQ
jgi:lysosomal acid lipase/cholesteryl ester hydrolase